MTFKIEPWRAVYAHNGALESFFRPVAADSYDFYEEQEQDPDQN